MTDFRQRQEFKKGRSGEQKIAEVLRRRGWYIIPSYDYSGEDGNKAPRLQGLSDAFAYCGGTAVAGGVTPRRAMSATGRYRAWPMRYGRNRGRRIR
jgi:hypothetical protein